MEFGCPVETDHIVLTQGFNGPYFSRLTTKRPIYAVDIAAPPSTPVLAPRDGIVDIMEMKNVSFSRNLDLSPSEMLRYGTETNFMILLHGNNVRTLVGRLMAGSQYVKRGQRVREGQTIALSGENGWPSDIPSISFTVLEHFPIDPLFGKFHPRTDMKPFSIRGYNGPMDHEELMALYVSRLGSNRRAIQELLRVS